MGVVRTDKWLKRYVVQWPKAQVAGEKFELQQKLIISLLKDAFHTDHLDELQQQLLGQGLFLPTDDIEPSYRALQDRAIWHLVHKQYTELREKWKGPNVPIYLFPVNTANPTIREQLGMKMGVSYRDKIVLFIGEMTSDQDVQALVTHEYHHCCRLTQLKLYEGTMTLLESMVMEGLAEKAVAEEVGRDALAIWTSRYDKADLHSLWALLLEQRMMKGRDRHYPYLFGGVGGIPEWAGYYLGYRIVDQAMKNDPTLTTTSMMKMEAEEILQRSFSAKRGRAVAVRGREISRDHS
jgi:uncharacterized protein YjaZ